MSESSDCKKTEAEGTRLLLVGKTGSGKSTLGNILLKKSDVRKRNTDTSLAPPGNSEEQGEAMQTAGNEDLGFVVGRGFGSVTETCVYKESQAWGRRMQVIDTPGFFDTARDGGKVLLELSKVMSLSAPGPNAVLFVTRCDVRFTEEEFGAYEKIVEMFGEEMKQHIVLVFSRGDTLEGDAIEDFLEDPECPNLKTMMKTVGDNYTVISKTSDTAVREREVKQLLQKIDLVSKNGKKYYTNDDLEKMTKEIVKETEKLMEERKISWAEAEYRLKKGLADDDKRFRELQRKLIVMTVISSAFLILAGVLGGVAGVFAVGATVKEAATGAGVGTFVSIVFTNFMEFLAYKNIKANFGHKKSGSCHIM